MQVVNIKRKMSIVDVTIHMYICRLINAYTSYQYNTYIHIYEYCSASMQTCLSILNIFRFWRWDISHPHMYDTQFGMITAELLFLKGIWGPKVTEFTEAYMRNP